jgi:hypothetical protein
MGMEGEAMTLAKGVHKRTLVLADYLPILVEYWSWHEVDIM